MESLQRSEGLSSSETNSLRWWLLVLALAAGFFCLACADDDRSDSGSSGGEDPQATRPLNIVFLLADDLGFSDVGVQGSKVVPTPHIDGLAAEGARFTQAYATAASCGPSRAAILSGRYQQRFGFEFNTGPRLVTHVSERGLEPSITTVSEVLQEAGYATGVVGKWHLGSQDRFRPLQRGFDEFFGFLPGQHPYFADTVEGSEVWETIMRGNERAEVETEYLTDAFAREAVSFIERHAQERFFLYVPFNAVHHPIEASAPYLERFPDALTETARTYRAMVSALDDAVGAILQALEDEGIEGDTLVVFSNDNGGGDPDTDNAPLRLSKHYLFEGGIRVPMIVRWPGVTRGGQTVSGITSLLDLFPTFLSAARVDVPSDVTLDGVDLRPHLAGAAVGSPHETLFWRNGPNLAVRRDRWKLVQAGDHVWLFDLEADIGETTNVAADHPEVVTELLSAFDGWASEMRDPAWPSRRSLGDVVVDGVVHELHI